jgi:hypothetical protein
MLCSPLLPLWLISHHLAGHVEDRPCMPPFLSCLFTCLFFPSVSLALTNICQVKNVLQPPFSLSLALSCTHTTQNHDCMPTLGDAVLFIFWLILHHGWLCRGLVSPHSARVCATMTVAATAPLLHACYKDPFLCCKVSPVGGIGNKHCKGHTLHYSEPEPAHPQWYCLVVVLCHVLRPVRVTSLISTISFLLHHPCPPFLSISFHCLLLPTIPDHAAEHPTAQACRSTPSCSSSCAASRGCQSRCMRK